MFNVMKGMEEGKLKCKEEMKEENANLWRIKGVRNNEEKDVCVKMKKKKI